MLRNSFLRPELKAFRASSDGVVACSSGVSNFCTVLSDSPSLFRISDAVLPSTSLAQLLPHLQFLF
jgi:hypothetical protein